MMNNTIMEETWWPSWSGIRLYIGCLIWWSDLASISWASSILLLQSCSFGPVNKLLFGNKPLPWPKNIIDRRPLSSPTPTASFIIFNSIQKARSSVVELSLRQELCSSFSALKFFHLETVHRYSASATMRLSSAIFTLMQSRMQFQASEIDQLIGGM